MTITKYPMLFDALKSVVPDAEAVGWREAKKLGYTHDLIEVYYSHDHDGHSEDGQDGMIIAIANHASRANVAIATHILETAVVNKSLIFVADKDNGYMVVGLIKAEDYEANCEVRKVINSKAVDDLVSPLSKSFIEDYVLHEDVIQDACARATNQSFAQASRWGGWSKSLTNPTAAKLEELAKQYVVEFKVDPTGWHAISWHND